MCVCDLRAGVVGLVLVSRAIHQPPMIQPSDVIYTHTYVPALGIAGQVRGEHANANVMVAEGEPHAALCC